MMSTTETGHRLAEALNPGLEATLEALYGGLPAAINGLNAALEVFAAEDAADGQP